MQSTVKRSESVVASIAKARRHSALGHLLRIQHNNGAKQSVTSTSCRCSPFLSWASDHHSRSCWRSVEADDPSNSASRAATLVMPHYLASTMPKLHNAKTWACGRL